MPHPSREKLFARIDADGRVIPSTLVRRLRKPRIGRWVEIANANVCCPDTTTTVI